MFNPVLDVLAVKTLEKKIGRKLTSYELDSIRYSDGDPVPIPLPNGDIIEIKIDMLTLSELLTSDIDLGRLMTKDMATKRYNNGCTMHTDSNEEGVKISTPLGRTPEENAAYEEWTPKLKQSGFRDIEDENGSFSQNIVEANPVAISYFEKLSLASPNIKYETDLDKLVMGIYETGKSIRDIERILYLEYGIRMGKSSVERSLKRSLATVNMKLYSPKNVSNLAK